MGLMRVLGFCFLFITLIISVQQCRAGDSEKNILIQLKNSLNKTDWLEADDPCTKWEGIKCTTAGNVTEINLADLGIEAPVPTEICGLKYLQRLDLGDNYMTGEFPDGLLNCTELRYLNLSQNLIVGFLPTQISRLSKLVDLDLNGNNFTGEIPSAFGDLPELQSLNLTNNLLNGTIPADIGRLTNLRWLDLSFNPFAAGPIPEEFGNLTKLLNLHMAEANLNGPIPESLQNLKQMTYFFDLSQNNLEGKIPAGLMNLPNLRSLELYNNRLSGELPSNLGNLSSISDIDFANNSLTGSIPASIGKLQNLELLHLWQNNLEGEIPPGLADLPKLKQIRLFQNRLNGSLPQKFGANSPIAVFDVSTNFLTGSIPPDLCKQGRLIHLIAYDNQLSGPIPEGFGSCPSLIRLRIGGNTLNGSIPAGMWQSANLNLVELYNNSFSGPIHSTIGQASNLSFLMLWGNQFEGQIPPEVGRLGNLSKFHAHSNRLSGSLPAEIGNLKKLYDLQLHDNQINGSIPTNLKNCALAMLDLSKNQLTGEIPAELGSIVTLTELDLSYNHLTGQIPEAISKLEMNKFNVSYNNLSGKIPSGLLISAFESSFLGNADLCGEENGLDYVKSCSIVQEQKHKKGPGALAWAVGGTFAAAALILFLGSCFFYKKYGRYFRNREEKSSWSLTSFHRLKFNEYEVLDSLDEDNVIGIGGSGKVYKTMLENGQVVAVKKLWTDGKENQKHDYGFRAEVETLGKIRHRNIVKLLCCCSNEESKLLVYEYMENGSLGDLLHGSKGRKLNWHTRFHIALGAAQGISYLHHDYSPQILHCDVKSNNILLDENYEAHVADFGLAKILQSCGTEVSLSSVAGTHGYIAPEYAYTLKVNEKSDIYSFGVVLLELITGRRPIEDEFGDGDLVKWVCEMIQNKKTLADLIDPKLIGWVEREMAMVLKVAILCTSSLPMQRPSMREVVQMLQEASPEKNPPSKTSKELHSHKDWV